MNLLVPAHQFEIRFSPILNFQHLIGGVLAPFSQMTRNVEIENENSYNARYNLFFNPSPYNILVAWDRLVLRTEGDLTSFVKNNSIVEEPFFNIFGKLKEASEFSIKNVLCYTIAVNFDKNLSDKESLENFQNNYIQKVEIASRLGIPTDLGIIFEHKDQGKLTNVTFGPYFGIADLERRNALPMTRSTLEDAKFKGSMAEIKISDQVKSINFSTYKHLVQETQKIINGLWQ